MTVHVTDIDLPPLQVRGSAIRQLHGLTDITVVFGRNGSGKSQLLRALQDGDIEGRHYVVPERGGNIGYDMDFLAHQFQGGNRRVSSGTNTAPSHGEEVVARIHVYLVKRGAQRGTLIGPDPGELEDLFELVLPDLAVHIRDVDSPYGLQRRSTGGWISSIDELSSGEVQAFKLALDLITICAIWAIEDRDQRVLLIDEPDLHLHADLQQRVARLIIELARRFGVQVVVATHSTTFLSALGGHSGDGLTTSVIYLDAGAVEQRATPFTERLQEMTSILGGHALMGPLFGVPLLLVEGPDDYEIWSQVPRHRHPGAPRLSVIPCGGRPELLRTQRSLEQIFQATLDTGTGSVGFALVDRDAPAPTAGPDCPQAFVPFVQLACHESENLYLTDEVLALLSTDWEHAKAGIKGRSPEFGEKQARLDQVDAWDRQSDDIKDVIKQVALILDPKQLPWTSRVGSCLGRTRPTGQLGEFIGDGVVIAIWGPDAEAGGG